MWIYVKDNKVRSYNENLSDVLRSAKLQEPDDSIFEVDSVPECSGRYDFIDGEFILNEEDVAKAEAEAAAKESVQYVFDRRASYPTIGDQLDALFKAGVFPEDMAAQIQAVKDSYPKPDAS